MSTPTQELMTAYENVFLAPLMDGHLNFEVVVPTWLERISGTKVYELKLNESILSSAEMKESEEQMTKFQKLLTEVTSDYLTNSHIGNATILMQQAAAVLEFAKTNAEDLLQETYNPDGKREKIFETWGESLKKLEASGLLKSFSFEITEGLFVLTFSREQDLAIKDMMKRSITSPGAKPEFGEHTSDANAQKETHLSVVSSKR